MSTADLLTHANDKKLNAYDIEQYGARIQTVNENDFTDNHRATNLFGSIRPRPYQVPSVNFMLQRDPENPKKFKRNLRASLCDHRRSGKTLRNLMIVKIRALAQKGLYFFVYPTLNQGRKVIWDAMGYDENGEAFNFIDLFPWVKRDNHLMQLTLPNGSIIQIVGAVGIDGSADHLRGTNPIFACFDEFAEMPIKAWDVLSPVFGENGGSAMFTFTPKGKNHAFDLHMDYTKKFADNSQGRYFAETLTIDDTKRSNGNPVVDEDYLQELRDRGVSEQYIQQEFYCSFEVSQEESFYAEYLDKADREGRIGCIKEDTSLGTIASYDIGIGTEDWVTVWYHQIVNENVINTIGYEEFPGRALQDILPHVSRRYDNVVAHVLPWDASKTDDVTGLTKIQRLEEMKITNLPILRVTRLSISDGIDMVRSLFRKFYFDKAGCYEGIERLRKYRKQIDRQTGIFKSKPVHDEASHGADALRTFANALAEGLLDEIVGEMNINDLPEYVESDIDYWEGIA